MNKAMEIADQIPHGWKDIWFQVMSGTLRTSKSGCQT
jgi:hypothetical protein